MEVSFAISETQVNVDVADFSGRFFKLTADG